MCVTAHWTGAHWTGALNIRAVSMNDNLQEMEATSIIPKYVRIEAIFNNTNTFSPHIFLLTTVIVPTSQGYIAWIIFRI